MNFFIHAFFKTFFASFWYYLRGVVQRMRDEEGFLLASGIAFNTILCSIPLLLLFTSFLGTFLRSTEVQWIDDVVQAIFRDQPYAETIKNALKQIVSDIIADRTSYGIFGAAVLLGTGTSLFSSVRNALHRVFRVKSSKHLLLSILEDLLWVFVIGILFITLNFVTWIYEFLEATITQLPGMGNFTLRLLDAPIQAIVSFVLTLFMFFIVYRFIPDVAPSSRIALCSALTTAILWETAVRVFAWYLTNFYSFREIYGTYAFFLVLLFWIYISSILFLAGGIVGQLYREKYRGSSRQK